MRHQVRRLLFASIPVAVMGLTGCGDSVAAPGLGGEPSAPVGPVQAALDSFRTANPGVLSAIGLVQREDGELLGGASGFLDESRTIPIDLESKFSIGSTTKTFTATMVLQLMEEGMVELDRPVAHYVSVEWAAVLDSVPYGPEITVRQALSHRSGIYDYLVSPLQSQLLSNPGRVFTPLEAFRFVRSGAPNFPPGTDFNYSNTNFLLLGHVVENLTGVDYTDALEARILSRVGMGDTFMYHGSTPQRVDVAHSYETIGGVRFDNLDFSSSGWAQGAGGLISTVADLVKFLRALGSDDLFMDSGTLPAMTDLGENTWYGLGVQIDDHPLAGRCFGHGGYSFASTAHVRHCSESGVTYSAFYGGDGSITGAHLDIVDGMLGAAL